LAGGQAPARRGLAADDRSAHTNALNETHRPRFLLSGLLSCGVCGGGYTITAKDRYGCARRVRQGMCTNSRGIKRQDPERRILDGLRCTLVTPDLVAEFIDEYRAEWNRLQGELRSEASQRDRKLADVKRKLAGFVDPIERGIITPTTKERLEALEAEKAALEQVVVEPALPVIRPNLAEHYRSKVAQLQAELVDPELAAEAKSVLRAMIKTIKVTPGEKRGCVCLELHGELATILAITADRQNGTGPRKSRIQASVVAGACIDRELKCAC
jgi:site-specific DNA recombinase